MDKKELEKIEENNIKCREAYRDMLAFFYCNKLIIFGNKNIITKYAVDCFFFIVHGIAESLNYYFGSKCERCGKYDILYKNKCTRCGRFEIFKNSRKLKMKKHEEDPLEYERILYVQNEYNMKKLLS